MVVCNEVLAAIERLTQPEEDVILCGDMNDEFHPARIFVEQGPFRDVQAALLLAPIITHPCRPSARNEDVQVLLD